MKKQQIAELIIDIILCIILCFCVFAVTYASMLARERKIVQVEVESIIEQEKQEEINALEYKIEQLEIENEVLKKSTALAMKNGNFYLE